MKIFKILPLLLVFAIILALSSCDDNGPIQSEVRTLNVYNWGEYISDEDDEEYGLIDVNAAFEKHFNDNLASKYGYRIKVNYSTYANNEDMYAKITNSAVAYDIVIPSEYMIQKMIANDLLHKIDYSIVTDFDTNINDEFKGLPHDEHNEYSVPYTYGMLGVIYNKNFVDESDVADQSWGLLWNEKYKGKILQFNNPRDAFGTAMYWKNININSKDPEDWENALQYLKKQKPLLQAYVNDEIFNKMTGESAYIAPYFAGDFLTMAKGNENLSFYYPKEGTNYFVDAMCIPKTSKNVAAANEYINFMISPDIAKANSLYIGYASPNIKVTSDADYYDKLALNYDMDPETIQTILYGKTKTEAKGTYNYDMAYEDFYKDDSVDIQAHVNELWEELKTESSTEPWIHVASVIIFGGVVSLAIYDIYVKKKRSRDYRLRDKTKRKNQKKLKEQ